MPSRSVDQHLLGRVGWTILGGLTVLAVLAGIWPITGTLTTWVPLLALPAAAGLPFLLPPLRVVPLGDTTWAFWAIDLAGLVVLLLTAYVVLRAARRRCPEPSRQRAFARGVGVTVVAVVAGNVVRGVLTSFAARVDLPVYLGQLVLNVVVSMLLGLVLGLLVGLAAAVAGSAGRQRVSAPS